MATKVREEVPATSKETPKTLRVVVDAVDAKDGRPVHINVRIPVILLRFGVRLANVIPPQAQQRVNEAMHEQGMDVDVSQMKPEDMDELITQLRDMSIDIDHPEENVKVRIYAE